MAKKASILHNKTWNMFGGVHCYWWRSVYVLAKVRLHRKISDSHLIITRVSNKLQIFSSEFSLYITNGLIFVFSKKLKHKSKFPPNKRRPYYYYYHHNGLWFSKIPPTASRKIHDGVSILLRP